MISTTQMLRHAKHELQFVNNIFDSVIFNVLAIALVSNCAENGSGGYWEWGSVAAIHRVQKKNAPPLNISK